MSGPALFVCKEQGKPAGGVEKPIPHPTPMGLPMGEEDLRLNRPKKPGSDPRRLAGG